MDQNLTSLIWTIVAIAAIFYVMNMFAGDKEGYQNEQQTGALTQIQDIQKKQQQPMAQQQQAIAQQLPAVQQQQQQPMAQQLPAIQQEQAIVQQQAVATGDNLTSQDLLPNENGFSSWGPYRASWPFCMFKEHSFVQFVEFFIVSCEFGFLNEGLLGQLVEFLHPQLGLLVHEQSNDIFNFNDVQLTTLFHSK